MKDDGKGEKKIDHQIELFFIFLFQRIKAVGTEKKIKIISTKYGDDKDKAHI